MDLEKLMVYTGEANEVLCEQIQLCDTCDEG